MENQASSKGIILNNGVYYGIILILSSLIIFALNMHFDPKGGYFNFAVLAITTILFPVLGMSAFKKNNNGFMTWGQGVKIGIGIVLVGSVIGVLYQHIFTGFIEPEFYTQLEEVTRIGLEDAGLTEEQIDSQIAMQAKFQGTAIGDAVGLLFMAFVGFVVSAIVAAIKKHSEEDKY